jgi:hypothetical protein
MHGKRPELWSNDWILHDIAPAHKELCMEQFMAQKYINELEHPPFSPDFTPNSFWLFQ